ncbi:hypothetical protein BGZ80_003664, partial [Entomortierella chlamydospora]
MAYQRKFLATATEDNGVWIFADINGNGSHDLDNTKVRNTSSSRIEGHGPHNESRFQQHSLATGTAFNIKDNGIWLMQEWTCNGKVDLVYIKTRNTASKRAASGVLHGDLTDLYYIKTRNTESGMVKVHVVSASSGWKSRLFYATTSSVPEDNGQWLMVDFIHQKQSDLA